MHDRLLRDVIMRQAGTLSKAILEAVMNAADAEATKISITFDPDGRTVRLKDDGRGFRSKDEIQSWFEVFGQPHDQSEAKTYGTFRMGRGQMFAFGKNVWRTASWTMVVDIEREGLSYRLIDEPDHVKGCGIDIEFYKRQTQTDFYSLQRDLTRWCKYAPIDVILNGKAISSPPAKQKWDHETDEAYFRIKATGDLTVYNLGIFVHDLPSYKFGCGGEVVSKRQLKVNFARNDVQHDCPEWPLIARTIRELAGVKSKPRNAPMTDGQRQFLAEQIITGALTGYDIGKAKVITAVNGRHYTVESLTRWGQVSHAETGDRPAVRAMENEVAFMLAKETLERFDVETVPELLKILQTAADGYYRWPQPIPYEEAVRAYAGVDETLDESDLNPNLRAWLAITEHAAYPIAAAIGEAARPRKLHVGQSSTSDAWTDGSTYITLNSDFLEQLDWNAHGFARLGILLVDMFVHETDSKTGLPDHTHFEQLHRLMPQCLPQFIQMCVEGTTRILEKEGRRMSKQIAEWQSDHVRVEQAKDAFAKQRADHDAASKGKGA